MFRLKILFLVLMLQLMNSVYATSLSSKDDCLNVDHWQKSDKQYQCENYLCFMRDDTLFYTYSNYDKSDTAPCPQTFTSASPRNCVLCIFPLLQSDTTE